MLVEVDESAIVSRPRRRAVPTALEPDWLQSFMRQSKQDGRGPVARRLISPVPAPPSAGQIVAASIYWLMMRTMTAQTARDQSDLAHFKPLRQKIWPLLSVGLNEVTLL